MTDELQNKVKRFKDQMITELENNEHKGPITDWDDYNSMICDLEYHKAKMMMAITIGHCPAIKEYVADCANILFAIGNLFDLYESDEPNYFIAHELNRGDMIRMVKVKDQIRSRKI